MCPHRSGGPLNYYKTQPPWEFLLSASRNSLQSYELSRLSHAANLRKEIGALLDLWMDENSAAMLARWLMEQRERPQQGQQDVSSAESLPRSVVSKARQHTVLVQTPCPIALPIQP